VIETSLILRSIGYQGTAIDGVPYEPSRDHGMSQTARSVPDQLCRV
jgi:hypothetical protein